MNGSVKVFGLNVSAGVSYAYSRLKTADLRLYNLFITEGSLKGCLNTQASGARNYMKDEGNDARVVSEVWVVLDAYKSHKVKDWDGDVIGDLEADYYGMS